ncbi:MAG TPA: PAS domain-containing protein [bacterium]|nr:PAS domain-containing protein [bacterium]
MTKKTLWELLWDYDPNGLIVVDSINFIIKIVNPAFCSFFKKTPEQLLTKKLSEILFNYMDFQYVWQTKTVIRGKEIEYPEFKIILREVIFPIPDENIVAGIFVDMTAERSQKIDLQNLKNETIEKVNKVVDKQMKVAQEIAGLLGETTAETKASLLKLVEMLKKEHI